jgi:hypothetical protein
MKLTPISVSSNDLLLDPHNPRLVTSFQSESGNNLDDPVGCQQILERRFQVPPSTHDPESTLGRYIQDRNDEDQEEFFSIRELKDSIRNIGFVGIQNVIVRKHEASGKYVVLEGNRRIASVKAVLREHADAPIGDPRRITDAEILASLNSIEVMVFDTQGREESVIQDEISTMLGLRHYGSQLMWEPLPRAKNIYDEYMRVSSDTSFRYSSELANKVASTLAIDKAEVQAFLKAYIMYSHLARIYRVKPRHFSLVMAGVQNQNLTTQEFFRFDRDTFEPLGDTAERFDQVCEFEDRDQNDLPKVLRDPQSFSKLGKLLRDSAIGHEDAVLRMAKGLFDEVITKQVPLEDAYTQLLAFKKRHQWVHALEKLLEKQQEESQLNPANFMAEGQELLLRDNLQRLVSRFLRLMDG